MVDDRKSAPGSGTEIEQADPASTIFGLAWVPAYAGMTVVA
jgi:hypothetical protein